MQVLSETVSSRAGRTAEPEFSIIPTGDRSTEELLRMDAYSVAMAFVHGDFEVHGDLIAAVRFFESHKLAGLRSLWYSVAAHLHHDVHGVVEHRPESQQRDIQFHYDQSNQFYARFLDSHMQYSAADFSDSRRTLEEAQVAKLEGICRDLDLQPGDQFLDIGCGWGGLAIHAARHFSATVTGCTLSQAQWDFAAQLVKREGLEDRVQLHLRDYRELEGQFDKAASVGMFEHVGRKQLPEYFQRAHALLRDGGLFLNRGIVRPAPVGDGPETLFLQRNVFPGGELPHLAELVTEAGTAGFDIERIHTFRRDYGLTCRAWVARLQDNAETCAALVGARVYRTWLLYLAASAASFEAGTTDAMQMLLKKGENVCAITH